MQIKDLFNVLFAHFFNYEFVYIFLFCSLIFLFCLMLIKKQLIKKILLVLFSVSLVLSFFEIYLSFIMDKPQMFFNRNYVHMNNYVMLNKQKAISFFNTQNKTKHQYEYNENEKIDVPNNKETELVYDVTYSLNNNVFRFTKCDNSSKEVYVFLGCSFVFGFGINDDQTSAYYFSQLYNFKNNVINCGVRGSATNTVLNILNTKSFSPLILDRNSEFKRFFYLLQEEHIHRNARYEGNCVDGYLYENNNWYVPTILGKIKYIFARSYIFRKVFIPMIEKYSSKCEDKYMIESLRKMNNIVEKKYNSKLTILVWPGDYNLEFVKKLKLEKSLDLIFLPEYFNSEEKEYRIKHDGHPTSKANKEISEILYNHINSGDKNNG